MGKLFIEPRTDSIHYGSIAVQPAMPDSLPDCRIELFESVVAKNKTHPFGWVLFFGDPERTRTVDLQRDRLAC